MFGGLVVQVKAAPRGTPQRWALSSKRRSWTLGSWRLRCVVYSAEGKHVPPAHSTGCICQKTRQQQWKQWPSVWEKQLADTNWLQGWVAYLRCFIAFGLFEDQLPLGIHCEYSARRNAHFLIGKHILVYKSKMRKSIISFIYHKNSVSSQREKPQKY